MTEEPGRDPARFQAVLDAYQAERRLPTLVAGVLDGGALVWSGTAGGPTTVETQYRIGSITKTMTAVLVMQCHQDGLLDLDDPIGKFLPTGYAEATVADLLGHVSGMQSEPAGPWWERTTGRSLDALLGANDGTGRIFMPGHAWHYSNLGFALLGAAVARLREVTWAELVNERLWRPLGMSRTSYLPQAPVAQGFSVHHLAGTLSEEPSTDTRAMAPAGQVWSTIADLARFAAFLRSGDPGVLSAESLRAMRVPRRPATRYGLGMVVPGEGMPWIGHLGSMPGFQASLLIDPDSGSGAVALCNGTTGFIGPEFTRRLVLDTARPDPAPRWQPSVEVPDLVREVLGWWYWGNSAYEVRWENGLLEMRDLARGILAERLELRGETLVGVEGYHRGETLHVVRRGDGGISHLECATFIYTKVPYDPEVEIPGGHPSTPAT